MMMGGNQCLLGLDMLSFEGLPYSEPKSRFGHNCVKTRVSPDQIFIKKNIVINYRPTAGRADDLGKLIAADTIASSSPVTPFPGILDFGLAGLKR
jgi:hypothetical protein